MAFLFQKLSGVFEVRIHPTASSFRDIYNNSQADPDEDFVPGAQVGTLDLRKLAKNLSTMNSEEAKTVQPFVLGGKLVEPGRCQRDKLSEHVNFVKSLQVD
jgi:hypothetical protein